MPDCNAIDSQRDMIGTGSPGCTVSDGGVHDFDCGFLIWDLRIWGAGMVRTGKLVGNWAGAGERRFRRREHYQRVPKAAQVGDDGLSQGVAFVGHVVFPRCLPYYFADFMQVRLADIGEEVMGDVQVKAPADPGDDGAVDGEFGGGLHDMAGEGVGHQAFLVGL